MKNITAIFSILIILLVIVFSCSEKHPNSPYENNETTPAESYFPMTVGSWWVYEEYTYETGKGQWHLSKTDSVTVTGKESIDGKEACRFIHHKTKIMNNHSWQDTSYFSFENDVLYEYRNLRGYFKSINEWVKIADFNSYNGWLLLDTNGGWDDGGPSFCFFKGKMLKKINVLVDSMIEIKSKRIISKVFEYSSITDGMYGCATIINSTRKGIDSFISKNHFIQNIGLVYNYYFFFMIPEGTQRVTNYMLYKTILVDYEIK
ncbi:hypothetical protein ACFLSQ_05895 [Bacteroidota bacterium]